MEYVSQNVQRALLRPTDFNDLPTKTQLFLDEHLGIIDWKPTPEEIEQYNALRGNSFYSEVLIIRKYIINKNFETVKCEQARVGDWIIGERDCWLKIIHVDDDTKEAVLKSFVVNRNGLDFKLCIFPLNELYNWKKVILHE